MQKLTFSELVFINQERQKLTLDQVMQLFLAGLPVFILKGCDQYERVVEIVLQGGYKIGIVTASDTYKVVSRV